MVREIAGDLAGKTAVVQINTEESPALAARFAIRGIPALVILRQGKSLAAMSGARSKQAILEWFKKTLREAS